MLNRNTTSPASAAAKIAQSNQQTKEATAELTKQVTGEGTGGGQQAPVVQESTSAVESATEEVKDSGIAVGATIGGSMMKNPDKPAGVPTVTRPPGYYSRHAGKVRIGQKKWSWPMEAPLVPKEGEDDLKEYLDSMVERGLATLVKDDE